MDDLGTRSFGAIRCLAERSVGILEEEVRELGPQGSHWTIIFGAIFFKEHAPSLVHLSVSILGLVEVTFEVAPVANLFH